MKHESIDDDNDNIYIYKKLEMEVSKLPYIKTLSIRNLHYFLFSI